MASTIQSLPPEVVRLIAAGEVIDSVAAVVRELAENALDAEATRIIIALRPELWWLRVTDNGRGMSWSNLQRCALPHTTSKIRSCEDLWKITSLGFRGEALHSIAQLSGLEIGSCTGAEAGWRMEYDRTGKVRVEEMAAIAPGTIITVTDLFGPVPVRRQGLPSPTQQLKDLQEIIYHLALCHPQVTWQVWLDEELWLKIAPSATPQGILAQCVKRVHESDLQWVGVDVEGLGDPARVELTIGLPDRIRRYRADWVKVAVNGRFVRSPQLESTLIAGFARTLPRDRYPLCFLHLTIPPQSIDWNRHPAKTEIYLQDLPFWQEQISQILTQALKLGPAELGKTADNQRLGQLLKTAETQTGYHLNRQIQPTESPNNELDLIDLRAVAQVNQTYIVVEHDRGLWLVEQHIAHERVLYEQLQTSWQLVPIEPALILTQLSTSQVEQLNRLGLDLDSFGEQMWAVRTIPAILSAREDKMAALIELSWGGDLQEAQVAIACRSAIRNGTPLSLEEMQTLIKQWQKTRNPRTCPHGRPIFLALEETSLARFFRRHWVIGKSHGI